MEYKKTICLDFDGVMNTYDGWKGEDELFLPRDGVGEFLKELSEDYLIVVHSTRNILRISQWLADHGLSEYIYTICGSKPKAVAYVDDRGIRFDGDFSTTLKEIRDFRTYWEEPR